MEFPEDLLYSETHEWISIQGELATVGLTDHAQNHLKDIVYVELPEIGMELKKGQSMGVVESVKTVADIYAPLSGTVRESNEELKDFPQLINDDPYGKGWLLKMDMRDEEELKKLLTAQSYRDLLAGEE